MNKIFIRLFFTLLCVSCAKKKDKDKENISYESEVKTPMQLGQEIFEGEGNCFACHKTDQKIVAPSLQEIAKIYKQQNGDMLSFLKGEAKPLVDPEQYEVMKTNFSVTKSMSDDQLKALEAYIYSFSK